MRSIELLIITSQYIWFNTIKLKVS